MTVVALLCMMANHVAAQNQPPAAAQAPVRSSGPEISVVPLKVQVVISKYQGDKRVSSLPYELTVDAGGRPFGGKASVRMGAQVPVGVAAPGNQGQEAPAPGAPLFKDVGTNIDCTAVAVGQGRYTVTVVIEDTSVYADDQRPDRTSRVNGIPTFRAYRSTNTVVTVGDGRTYPFTMAADKITGEVIKADVTVTVVK